MASVHRYYAAKIGRKDQTNKHTWDISDPQKYAAYNKPYISWRKTYGESFYIL